MSLDVVQRGRLVKLPPIDAVSLRDLKVGDVGILTGYHPDSRLHSVQFHCGELWLKKGEHFEVVE